MKGDLGPQAARALLRSLSKGEGPCLQTIGTEFEPLSARPSPSPQPAPRSGRCAFATACQPSRLRRRLRARHPASIALAAASSGGRAGLRPGAHGRPLTPFSPPGCRAGVPPRRRFRSPIGEPSAPPTSARLLRAPPPLDHLRVNLGRIFCTFCSRSVRVRGVRVESA